MGGFFLSITYLINFYLREGNLIFKLLSCAKIMEGTKMTKKQIEAFVAAITDTRSKDIDVISEAMITILEANGEKVSPMAKLMWHKVIPNYIQLLVFLGVDHIFKEK